MRVGIIAPTQKPMVLRACLFQPETHGVPGAAEDRCLRHFFEGDDRQFQTLVMYLYEKGFRLFDAGYSSAIAWVLFLVILVVAVVNFTVARRIASKG